MSQSNPETSIARAALPIGSVVAGKYRIDGVLGEGGMGVVLSATNLDLDALVAIKVVRDEFANNEEVVSRMLQEARSAAKMHGTHMVRVLDVARLESGTPYIVMEHLEGGDLATLLSDRGALPIGEAVDYILQACDGLAEAHAIGIIHRDLKPENLFLARTPEGPVLKILDFGISKIIGTGAPSSPRTALTNAGCAVGSPYYMSPEQMRASPHVDERADIWSLGAVLFELLTGKSPFEGESVQVVCANVLSAEPPSLRSFSKEAPQQLELIIRRCLEKSPAARYDSVLALAAALRDFKSTELEASEDRGPRLASGISLVPTASSVPRRPRRPVLSSALLPSSAIGASPAPHVRLHTDGSALARDARLRDSQTVYSGTTAKPRALPVVMAAALTIALAGGALLLWRRNVALGAAEAAFEARASVASVAALPAAPARVEATPVRALPAQTPPIVQPAATATAKHQNGAGNTGRAAPVRSAARSTPRALGNAAAGSAARTPSLPAASKAAAAASAAFDDLQSASVGGQRAPVNAWNVDSLGGRN